MVPNATKNNVFCYISNSTKIRTCNENISCTFFARRLGLNVTQNSSVTIVNTAYCLKIIQALFQKDTILGPNDKPVATKNHAFTLTELPPKSLRANSLPACMATGVSSGFPSKTSPIA